MSLMWGPRGSGKSTYAEKLLLAFYSGGQTPWSSINQIKSFSAVLTASASNIVPFVVDEYKGWSFLESWQRLLLSETIRNCYDALTAKRGNKDARSQRLYPAVSPLAVAGEDTILEPAAQERMIEVFLSPKDHEGREKCWKRLIAANLPGLGLDYLRWSLEMFDQEMAALYQEADELLPKRMRDRIRHNVTIAVFGLRMLTKWLAERGAQYPEPALAEQIQSLIELQAQTRYACESSAKPPSIVDRMLEAMASAAEGGIFNRGFDFELGGFDSSGRPGHLYLRLQRIFPVFKEWTHRTRYEEEVLSVEAFRRQVKEEPYFIASNVAKHFPLAGSGRGGTKKTVQLNFATMLQLGLDVDGYMKGEIKENTSD